jgi:hypothetical protein
MTTDDLEIVATIQRVLDMAIIFAAFKIGWHQGRRENK